MWNVSDDGSGILVMTAMNNNNHVWYWITAAQRKRKGLFEPAISFLCSSHHKTEVATHQSWTGLKKKEQKPPKKSKQTHAGTQQVHLSCMYVGYIHLQNTHTLSHTHQWGGRLLSDRLNPIIWPSAQRVNWESSRMHVVTTMKLQLLWGRAPLMHPYCVVESI